ncbi:TPA: hypothetical protein ACH3X3_012197 [Trebouxia sp. C0006]
MTDYRRLNVAFTRARRAFIVVGSRSTLQKNSHWRSWLEWVDSRGPAVASYIVPAAAPWSMQSTTHGQGKRKSKKPRRRV